MVYCEGVEVESKLGKLLQAFRCDRPSEWQMDEFIRMAEDMHQEIAKLREAEKDAARYRWLKCKSSDDDMDVILYSLESREWDGFIDEAMQCK